MYGRACRRGTDLLWAGRRWSRCRSAMTGSWVRRPRVPPTNPGTEDELVENGATEQASDRVAHSGAERLHCIVFGRHPFTRGVLFDDALRKAANP